MTDILLPLLSNVYTMSDGEELSIPDNEMIAEATIPQPLTPEFACRILLQYEIPDKTRTLKIIEKNSNEFWDELCKELVRVEAYDPKIYAYFSLQKHRINNQSPTISRKVFWDYSNMVSYRLSLLPPNPLFTDYCDLAGVDHPSAAYCKGVISWCSSVLPHPLKYIESIDMEYKERERSREEFKKDIENGYSTFDDLPAVSEDLKPYLNKKLETHRRLNIRFQKWAFCRDFFEQIDQKFAITKDSGKSRLSEYHASQFDKAYSGVTKKKATRRAEATRKAEDRLIILPSDKASISPLYQCQFCYSYRLLEKQTRKQSIPPWHCPSHNCKTAYERWKRDLTRKGIGLEALRQSGF